MNPDKQPLAASPNIRGAKVVRWMARILVAAVLTLGSANLAQATPSRSTPTPVFAENREATALFTPEKETDPRDYAQREAANPQSADFRGDGLSIYLSSAAVVVAVVILLVLLL